MKASSRLVAIMLVLTLTASGCGPKSCTKRDAGADDDAKPSTSAVVELSVGMPVVFDLAGQDHEAELVRTAGISAEVVIASASPTTYTLTEGVAAEADLDADSVVETQLEVSDVGADRATLTLSLI